MDPSVDPNAQVTVKGYQLGWRGKSIVLCGGRMITGPPISLSGLQFYGFIWAIIAAYYYLLTEVAPVLRLAGYNFINLTALVLSFICNYFFFKAAFTDPGVILQNQDYDRAKLALTEEQIEENESQINQEVPRIYQKRFCQSCLIWRPPMASHCKICNHCVTQFDHHCKYINNCVGPRNRFEFVMYSNLFILISGLYFPAYFLYQREVFSRLSTDEETQQILSLLYLAQLVFYPMILIVPISIFAYIASFWGYLYLMSEWVFGGSKDPWLYVPYCLVFVALYFHQHSWVNSGWYTRLQMEQMTLKEYAVLVQQRDLKYERQKYSWSEMFENLKKFYIDGFLCRETIKSQLRADVSLGQIQSSDEEKQDYKNVRVNETHELNESVDLDKSDS